MCSKLSVIALLLLALCSCTNKEHNEEFISGYEYFPLDTNKVRVYQVIKRSINLIEDITTKYYQKERLGNMYVEGEETVYVLEKFIKLKESDSWKELPDTIETIRITDGKIIQTENNFRYLKLIFPVLEDRQWDGNAYSILDKDIYTMKDLGKAFHKDELYFENTLLVKQASDTTDLTKRDLRYEVYAFNTGLVYKKSSRISLNFLTGDTLDGTILYQKYVYDAD